ncbi:hypothetical protein CN918_27025 [Priestia megaterium]|nr:hypothetical protein CN918_27025 [Priestia megaterium]
MSVKVVFSTKKDESSAVKDINEQLHGYNSKLIVYFVSCFFDIQRVAHLMEHQFPTSEVVGCSSGDEMVTGKQLTHSFVAMAFDESIVEDVKVEFVRDLKINVGPGVEEAFKGFESYYGTPANELSYKDYVGLVLVDGNTHVEEAFIEKISGITNVLFVGGSSSDDWKFGPTVVCAKGEALENAAAMVLVKPKVGFEIVKTQSLKTLGKKMVATKVDLEERAVLEFDGRPAVEVYAEHVGVPVEEANKQYSKHPLGIVADSEIFVRSPYQAMKNGGMKLASSILEGMEVELLEATNIVEETKEVLEHIENPLALVQFNCALRAMELAQTGQMNEYINLFSSIPNIGFTCYGEFYLGHMNQTSTMLIFKKS